MIEQILSPFELSPSITLENRIVMAPMTRRFAYSDGCPSEKSIPYYSSRSAAGLIITEGTLITQDAIGYGNIPGIYSPEHIDAWSKITEAVHQKHGKIFLQLWHCGRVSHPHFHQGRLPVSASATVMTSKLGNSGYTCGESRAASLKEIEQLVLDYGKAAVRAIEAGFDGVEIHGANGYLIDQFLHHCTNQRTDQYGGSYENMTRFCLDVIQECGKNIGFDRLGLRLSPAGHMSEIQTHENDKHIFSFLLKQLDCIPVCYVHTGNFDDTIVFSELDNMTMTDFLRFHFSSNVIASGGYSLEKAITFISSNPKNLVAFGRPFIANPDLVSKIHNEKKWADYNSHLLKQLV